MTLHCLRVPAFVLCFLAGAPVAFAQDVAEPDETVATNRATADEIELLVRGLYVDMRVGAGYMVVNKDVTPTAQFPALSGSESLGAGALVALSLGYDLTDNIAAQLMTGLALVSGTRRDRVRDLNLAYGGPGIRVSFSAGERAFWYAEAGFAYSQAANELDEETTGAAILAGAGYEYFVHIRHFSAGVGVAVVAPLDPFRAFVALNPFLKYTF